MTVVRCLAKSWIMRQKSRRAAGSTPAVGSSRNRTSGRCSRAQPSASRCCHPPESCPASCARSEEHTSELQSRGHLVCRLLLEKKKIRVVCYSVVDPLTVGRRGRLH